MTRPALRSSKAKRTRRQGSMGRADWKKEKTRKKEKKRREDLEGVLRSFIGGGALQVRNIAKKPEGCRIKVTDRPIMNGVRWNQAGQWLAMRRSTAVPPTPGHRSAMGSKAAISAAGFVAAAPVAVTSAVDIDRLRGVGDTSGSGSSGSGADPCLSGQFSTTYPPPRGGGLADPLLYRPKAFLNNPWGDVW